MARDVQKEKTPQKRKKINPSKLPVESLQPATNSDAKIQKTPSSKIDIAKQTKQVIKDFAKVPIATNEDLEKMLTAIAFGIIPDRFGLEAGLDTRLKALDQIAKLKALAIENKNGNDEHQQISDATNIVFRARENNIYNEQQEEVMRDDANAADGNTESENN